MQKNKPVEKPEKERTPMDDIMKNMQFQMRYVMPVITFFISYKINK